MERTVGLMIAVPKQAKAMEIVVATSTDLQRLLAQYLSEKVVELRTADFMRVTRPLDSK